MKKYLIFLTFLSFAMLTQYASAGPIGANVNTNPFISNSTVPVTVTTMWVYSLVAKRVVIAYNAECSIAGPGNTTWLNLDILVGGVAIAPTNNNNAFCTSHGGNTLVNWTSVVANVVATLNVGWNVIQVRANRMGVGGNFWLDDRSLIVID